MTDASIKKKPMTIARLAQQLGLTEGTVSRALNNYPDIAEKTRDRVKKAAQESGYRPSSAARRLARGIVETVGFVLQSQSDQFFDPFLAEFLDGLSLELATHDWDLLLAAVPEGHNEIDVMERLVLSGKVGGFAVARVRREDQRIDYLRSANVPFVAHGRTEKCDDYSWIDIDNEKAIVDAVKVLADMGHEKIAYLGGDLRMNFAWLRHEGFARGVKEVGLRIPTEYIREKVVDEVVARGEMAALLALPDRPTAVICVSDAVAIGAIQAISGAGLEAGIDVSITGYGDLSMGAAIEPALTTFSQASRQVGREVGRMLLHQAKPGLTENSQILWEAKLMQRASANPPATDPAKLGRER